MKYGQDKARSTPAINKITETYSCMYAYACVIACLLCSLCNENVTNAQPFGHRGRCADSVTGKHARARGMKWKENIYENGGQQMYSLNRFNWPMLSAHDDLYPNIVSTCRHCLNAVRRTMAMAVTTYAIQLMYRCISYADGQSCTHLCESIILNGNALTTNGQRLVRVIRSEAQNDLCELAEERRTANAHLAAY